MDKGLTVPKWVLINRPKIPQMPQNLSAQAQKFGISMKKGFIWCPRSMIMPMVHQCPIYVPGFPKERKPHLKEKNLRNFDIENGKYVQEYIL